MLHRDHPARGVTTHDLWREPRPSRWEHDGLSHYSTELDAQRLDLLMATASGIRRIAVVARAYLSPSVNEGDIRDITAATTRPGRMTA